MRRLVPLVAALALAACSETFAAGAAVINGVSIGQEVLERRVSAQQQPGAETEDSLEEQRNQLLQLISEELIRQEVTRRGVEVDPARIDTQMQTLRQPGEDDASFENRVREAGLTVEELRDQIFLSLAVEEIRDTLAPAIPEADIREVYRISKQQFDQMRIRHILFTIDQDTTEREARRQARDTLAELRNGGDFAQLARRRSDDPGSARSGGRLTGWISVVDQNLDQTFLGAAADAKVGQVTDPVRTQFGFHLIRVDDRRLQTYQEVREQIREQLEQQQSQTVFAEFLTQLRRDAEIIVNPRYGDWDPETGSIVPHSFLVEPDTTGDGNLPPPVPIQPPGPITTPSAQ